MIQLRKFISILIFLFPLLTIHSETVDISITNLDNTDGQIVMGIYKDQKTWTAETPYLNKNFPKGSNVKGTVLNVSFDLEPGVYGIGILDDENWYKKMNYNWIGWPLEGFGFTNIFHNQLSKPRFDTFKFTVVQGQRTSVTIKVKNM